MCMDIVLAADHAGFEMKEYVKEYLTAQGHTVHDVGASVFNPVDDYPHFMRSLVKELRRHSNFVGIMFGGSGQGEAIAVNRHIGIRAIVYAADNLDLITLGREHNNANVLSIGARFISNLQAQKAIDLFLSVPFPGIERHRRRNVQIDEPL